MSQAEWNNNQGDDPGASGLAEGAPEERFAKARVHFNGSTLALVASFIAAIAVLYLLGLQNKPRAATANELESSKRIDENLKIALIMTNDPQYQQNMDTAGGFAKAIMSLGNGEDYAEPNLPRNPFEHDVPVVSSTTNTGTANITPPPPLISVDPNVRTAQQEFMGLRLQMVMINASGPSALVNNLVLQPGTKLKYLTVVDIKPGEVLLKYTDKDGKDWPFDLTSEPQQKKE